MQGAVSLVQAACTERTDREHNTFPQPQSNT
jgi:hypothetical protein